MAKSVYLIAFLLTLLVFASVFFIARDEDGKRINAIYDRLIEQQETLVQINNAFLTDANACDEFRPLVQKQLNQLYVSYTDIEKFDMYSLRIESAENKRLKRQYLISSMGLFQLLDRTSQTCDYNIKPVLYFWPDDADCPTCATLVYQLEEIKRSCPSVRVFAFPSNPDNFEPVVTLKKRFDVNTSPAIVVGWKPQYDIVSTDELKRMIGCAN